MAEALNSPIVFNVVTEWLVSNYLEILAYGATILFLLVSIFLQDEFSIGGFLFAVALSIIGAICFFIALVLIVSAWKPLLYLVGGFVVYGLIFLIRTYVKKEF